MNEKSSNCNQTVSCNQTGKKEKYREFDFEIRQQLIKTI